MADDYRTWAQAWHGRAFLRRSAERNAAFLLPRLAAGQRVVDVGCGPGAITAGLAARVAPGEVIGVDVDAGYLDTARRLHDLPNLRYEQADGAALPLADDEVDVAFLHAVLQHVPSPVEVLREVRRVVRPNGLVAIGDADLHGYLVHPLPDGLAAALDLDRRTRRHPDVGRQLPALLHEAGFTDVEYRVTANVVAGEAMVGATAQSSVARFEAAPFAAHAVAQGWADEDGLARMVTAWRAWGEAPGATFVTLWCEALARC